MNMSEVNTVDDLLALVGETEETETTKTEESENRFGEFIDSLELDEAYTLALSLLVKLGSFHQGVIEDLKEEGNELDRLVVWAQDEQKIHTAYDLLNEVVNND